MNANDELRAMLDERGANWDYGITGAATTKFSANGVDLTFMPMRDGLICTTILTPAQAIAATLGTGTLTAEQVSRATYAHSIHADCADADWQAIADELNAMSGAGTCHNVHEPPKDTTFWPSPHFKCSECGATHVSMEYVYFCPNCGRKVVGE